MSTSPDFITFVCDQINDCGIIRARKMFGEYMVYVNGKPLFLVCDDIVFVKKSQVIAELMEDCETGYPYEGAKEWYILDIDNAYLAHEVIRLLEPVTPYPVPKKRKRADKPGTRTEKRKKREKE